MPDESTQLADHGWDVSQVFDLCWLDCPAPGYRKVWAGREICLCLPHALLLERGEYAGDYGGAMLPAESVSPDWPWVSLDNGPVPV